MTHYFRIYGAPESEVSMGEFFKLEFLASFYILAKTVSIVTIVSMVRDYCGHAGGAQGLPLAPGTPALGSDWGLCQARGVHGHR